MTIAFNVPQSVEDALASMGQSPSAAAREAVLVELYRLGKLSHGALAEILGSSRDEVDGVLHRHGVTQDLLTPAELAKQVDGLRRLAG